MAVIASIGDLGIPAVLVGLLLLLLLALLASESADPHRVPGLGMTLALLVLPMAVVLAFLILLTP